MSKMIHKGVLISILTTLFHFVMSDGEITTTYKWHACHWRNALMGQEMSFFPGMEKKTNQRKYLPLTECEDEIEYTSQ